MSWNYRVVNCPTKYGNSRYLGLFEVYYDDDGNPNGRISDPIVTVDAEEGLEGLVGVLQTMLRDAQERAVLVDEQSFPEPLTRG